MYFMKYINKYIKFFENFDLVEPKVTTQVMVAEPKIDENEISHEGEERTEEDVVNRLSDIYKGLSSDEKKKINSYFK